MPKISRPLLAYLLWLGGLLALAGCLCQPAAGPESSARPKPIYPGKEWTRTADPAALGWSAEKLAQAREFSGHLDTAAVMIVQDGVVVDAWGDVGRDYKCHSMRKSLFSALMGLAVAQGQISLASSLAELGIDDKPPGLSAEEKTATVGDLIMARSGVYHPRFGRVPGNESRPAGAAQPCPGNLLVLQ